MILKHALLAPSILALLCGAACSGSSAQKPTTIDTKQKVETNTASTAEPGTFSLTVLAAPEKYAVDGDITEWGSLLPKVEPPKPAKDSKDTQEAPPVDAASPRDAESHIAVSIASNEVIIVAELGETAARDGLNLGLGTTPPEVAHVGEWGRGGAVWDFECQFEHNDISDGQWILGERNPPEVIAACEELRTNHEKFVQEKEKRFQQIYQIDRNGISVVVDGKPQTIEGAKAVYKPRGKNALVEISFPFKALPRVAEAPLPLIKLAARLVAPDAIASLGADTWAEYTLPKPAIFDKYGELRAAAFEAGIIEATRPSGLSFQPGDPLHVEALAYEGNPAMVTPIQKTIFEKIAMLGDVEVGNVPSDGLSVATFKDGKFISLMPVETDYNFTRPVKSGGMIERDGELHVVLFYEYYYSSAQGPMQPGWSVVAVARDGTMRQAAECEQPYGNWNKVWETMSEDKLTFRYRGTGFMFVDGRTKELGMEVVYRWDAKAKKYTCTSTEVSNPKPYPTKDAAAASTSTDGNALDDIPSLMKRPTNWEGLREITVTGSSALQCVTQTMGPKNGGWFRAHCTGDSVLEAVPMRGHRKTQTSVTVSSGKAEIYTPIAEGTEVSFKMKFEKAGARTMTIRWKKGLPTPSGVIEK